VTLAASLSLHGAAVLAVLLSISGETEVGPLFIDLTERARAGRGEAPAGAPAAAPTPRAQGVLRVARSSPPVTSPAPSAPQRAEMGERAPLAAAIAEPVAPPPATASSAPPEAAPPDPMPTIAGETDASAPGAASAAPSSSAAAAPEGPATLSEVFAGLSVGRRTPARAERNGPRRPGHQARRGVQRSRRRRLLLARRPGRRRGGGDQAPGPGALSPRRSGADAARPPAGGVRARVTV